MRPPILDARPLLIDYHPNPAQRAFHLDRGKVRERGMAAGTSAGKTYAAAFEAVDITMRERPGIGVIAAEDYPQLNVSAYTTLRKVLGRRLTDLEPYASFNQQTRILTWWNDWEWRFVSLKDPTSVEGLPDARFVWLTEARLVRKFGGPDGAWLNLTRRMRGMVEEARHAFWDSHSITREIQEAFQPRRVTWFRAQDARRPEPDAWGRYSVADCEDPDRRVYRWGTHDAMQWGTLNRGDGERIIRQYKGTAAKRILQGQFGVPEGVVFDAYSDAALHEPQPGTRFEWFSGGIDWGWTDEHPCALVLWGHVGSTSWILGEASGGHWGLERIQTEARRLADAWKLHRLDGIHAAPDVKWHGGHDKPEQAAALNAAGLDVDTYSGRVEDGVELINRRLAAGEIRIHPNCTLTRQDFENYVRGKDGKPDKDAYDPHRLDAARYGLLGGSAPESAGVLRPSRRRR